MKNSSENLASKGDINQQKETPKQATFRTLTAQQIPNSKIDIYFSHNLKIDQSYKPPTQVDGKPYSTGVNPDIQKKMRTTQEMGVYDEKNQEKSPKMTKIECKQNCPILPPIDQENKEIDDPVNREQQLQLINANQKKKTQSHSKHIKKSGTQLVSTHKNIANSSNNWYCTPKPPEAQADNFESKLSSQVSSTASKEKSKIKTQLDPIQNRIPFEQQSKDNFLPHPHNSPQLEINKMSISQNQDYSTMGKQTYLFQNQKQHIPSDSISTQLPNFNSSSVSSGNTVSEPKNSHFSMAQGNTIRPFDNFRYHYHNNDLFQQQNQQFLHKQQNNQNPTHFSNQVQIHNSNKAMLVEPHQYSSNNPLPFQSSSQEKQQSNFGLQHQQGVYPLNQSQINQQYYYHQQVPQNNQTPHIAVLSQFPQQNQMQAYKQSQQQIVYNNKTVQNQNQSPHFQLNPKQIQQQSINQNQQNPIHQFQSESQNQQQAKQQFQQESKHLKQEQQDLPNQINNQIPSTQLQQQQQQQKQKQPHCKVKVEQQHLQSEIGELNLDKQNNSLKNNIQQNGNQLFELQEGLKAQMKQSQNSKRSKSFKTLLEENKMKPVFKQLSSSSSETEDKQQLQEKSSKSRSNKNKRLNIFDNDENKDNKNNIGDLYDEDEKIQYENQINKKKQKTQQGKQCQLQNWQKNIFSKKDISYNYTFNISVQKQNEKIEGEEDEEAEEQKSQIIETITYNEDDNEEEEEAIYASCKSDEEFIPSKLYKKPLRKNQGFQGKQAQNKKPLTLSEKTQEKIKYKEKQKYQFQEAQQKKSKSADDRESTKNIMRNFGTSLLKSNLTNQNQKRIIDEFFSGDETKKEKYRDWLKKSTNNLTKLTDYQGTWAITDSDTVEEKQYKRCFNRQMWEYLKCTAPAYTLTSKIKKDSHKKDHIKALFQFQIGIANPASFTKLKPSDTQYLEERKQFSELYFEQIKKKLQIELHEKQNFIQSDLIKQRQQNQQLNQDQLPQIQLNKEISNNQKPKKLSSSLLEIEEEEEEDDQEKSASQNNQKQDGQSMNE